MNFVNDCGGVIRLNGCASFLILMGTLLSTPMVLAQVPVVDRSDESSSGISTGDPRSVVGMDRTTQTQTPVLVDTPPLRDPDDSIPEPGGNATLFYQLQVLRDEVQELRGMVEEQAHQLDRLGREQQEQYLDIDRRLSSRQGQMSSTIESPAIQAIPSNGTGSERDVYTAAFQLTREKRFQEAIDAFNRLIVQYPNGQYTANAFYWLGELYLALPQPELEKSRQSFVQVVNLYPENTKVPDALYKLGVVYDRLGDREKGLEYLNRVITQFSGSPAARLAQNYKAELSPG